MLVGNLVVKVNVQRNFLTTKYLISKNKFYYRSESAEVETNAGRVYGGSDVQNSPPYCTEYVAKLYESLLRSVGETGTIGNFIKNVSLLNHIIRIHFASKECISDLSDTFKAEREKYFHPIFEKYFNMVGL